MVASRGTPRTSEHVWHRPIHTDVIRKEEETMMQTTSTRQLRDGRVSGPTFNLTSLGLR